MKTRTLENICLITDRLKDYQNEYSFTGNNPDLTLD